MNDCPRLVKNLFWNCLVCLSILLCACDDDSVGTAYNVGCYQDSDCQEGQICFDGQCEEEISGGASSGAQTGEISDMYII